MSELFHTSAKEMNRRKSAFLTLSVSVIVGAGVASATMFSSSLHIALPAVALFASLLLPIVPLVTRLLEKSKHFTVLIDDKSLQRNFGKSREVSLLKEIRSIRIKRTVRNVVREIRVGFAGSRFIHINGLDDFERFANTLLSAVKNNVSITRFKEPIDFDHPLFYPIFGMLVGTVSIFALKFSSGIQADHFKYMQLGTACFSGFAGAFFVFAKPVAGRYGKRAVISDYGIGLSMALAGICLFIVSGIF